MDYLSVKELAELKGCSERNIRDQIRKGKIYAGLAGTTGTVPEKDRI